MAVLVFAEAGGVVHARRTVPHGWGIGLAAGMAASLGLTAVLAAVTWSRRRKPARYATALLVSGLVMVVSIFVAWFGTAPHGTAPGQPPYVITSWVSVAGMAYTATSVTELAVVLIWTTTAAHLRGRRPPTGSRRRVRTTKARHAEGPGSRPK
jgi:hypothetical protein